jgi:hypothetical protein
MTKRYFQFVQAFAIQAPLVDSPAATTDFALIVKDSAQFDVPVVAQSDVSQRREGLTSPLGKVTDKFEDGASDDLQEEAKVIAYEQAPATGERAAEDVRKVLPPLQ